MQPIRLFATFVTGATCLIALPCLAEEKNPDVIACVGKSEGDMCQRTITETNADGETRQRSEPGACAMGECCTLDYSKGSPPESVCTPCLTCQTGPADPAVGSELQPSPDDEPPRAGHGDEPPASAPKSRGCRAGTASPGSAAALTLLLMGAAFRRRTQKQRALLD